MKDFHFSGWLLGYDLSKIVVKLAISLKHNILEILLDNNLFVDETKIIGKSSEFTHSDFLLKVSHQTVFKNAPEKFNARRFYVLTKPIETIKLYNRSFFRCYSLCSYMSMFT